MDGIIGGGHDPLLHDPLLMADTLHEILAREVPKEKESRGDRPSASLNGTDGEEAGTEKKATIATEEKGEQQQGGGGQRPGAVQWPARVDNLRGCISNLLIEFERESRVDSSSVLQFRPILDYLHEDRLWHRSVRHQPADIPQGRLQTANCGKFQMPGVAPMPIRDVKFPIWEAPFHPVPFADWNSAVANLRGREQPPMGEKMDRTVGAVGIVSLLLILCFLLCLLFCLCRQRLDSKRRREEIFESNKAGANEGNGEKRPMLENTVNNGPSFWRQTKCPPVPAVVVVPIRLVRQRPIPSPPPRGRVKLPIEDNDNRDEPAQVKLKSILRTPAKKTAAELPPPVGAGTDSMTTSSNSKASDPSGSSVYFTAQEHFFPLENDDEKDCSLVNLNNYEEEETIIGDKGRKQEADSSSEMALQEFEERAPELMDESTMHLMGNGGLDSAFRNSLSAEDGSSLGGGTLRQQPAMGREGEGARTPMPEANAGGGQKIGGAAER